MKEKHETFIYEGLGFPVELVDCPLKEVLGEWVLDINLATLQRSVFQQLLDRPQPLTGRELRFMRKFLELSTTEFAEKLEVSHATILQWEKEKVKQEPLLVKAAELY